MSDVLHRRLDALGPVAIEVHGHVDLPTYGKPPDLKRVTAADLLNTPGSFVVCARSGHGDVTIVSSQTGAVDYFWTTRDSCFVHGADALDVARAAKLPWQWNFKALADYLTIGHTLGTDTLHAAIQRVPATSITAVRAGIPVIHTFDSVGPLPSSKPADAIEFLLAALKRLPEAPIRISMSGGLDSRLLLAGLLALGRTPDLVVSGVPGSHDRETSLAIAQAFDLAIEGIVVQEQDVLATAPSAAIAANGRLPISHWAGLVHLVAAGIPPRQMVLIGANGELARSYYAPAQPSELAWSMRTGSDAVQLLLRRAGRPFQPDELDLVHPTLRGELDTDAITARLSRVLPKLPDATSLDVADVFFLQQHARCKTAADLAALRPFSIDWRTPFLDADWARAVRGLTRIWKLGDRFHRYAIGHLQPRLLKFPDDKGMRFLGLPALSRRRARWSGDMRRSPFLDQSIFKSAKVLNLLSDRAGLIADLVDPALTRRLVDRQRIFADRPHVVFSLMSIALWREAAQDTVRAS